MKSEHRNLLRGIVVALLAGTGVYLVAMDLVGRGGPTGRFVGEEAPGFSLPAVRGEGEAVALDDLEGKGVILAFWATYCDSCKRELPVLEEIHRELAGQDLAVVTVAAQPKADVRPFLDARELTLPVLSDGGTVHHQYNVDGIPYTVFIGPDGRVLDDHVGPMAAADLIGSAKRLVACAQASRAGEPTDPWCNPAGPATAER